MGLKEKLINTPKREDAGGRTSNRFAYQFYWALNKLMLLNESEDDFVLIMEFIDDIIVLDNSSNPEFIDFYQIKTNDQKNQQYITTSTITSKKKDESLSFIEKLMDNLNRYSKETRSLHYVSNKFFNFKMKDININSNSEWSIKLNSIGDQDLNKIKKQICEKCVFKDECSEKCHEIIYFDVSEFDVITYSDAIWGKFVNFLNDRYKKGDIAFTKAIFNTILSEIMRLNNNEKKATTYSELIKSKSITKQDFTNYLREFEKSFLMKDDWLEISSALRTPEENFNNIEILMIKKQWDKYKLDILDSDSAIIRRIRSDIRKLIMKKEFITYRHCIEYVHSLISKEDYYDKQLFPRDYYTAMIIGEMHYD